MARNVASHVVDIACEVAPIDSYWFYGALGSVLATGCLYDSHGQQCPSGPASAVPGTPAPAFSFTIPVGGGAATNVATMMGLTGALTAPQNYPDAQAIAVNLAGSVYVSIVGGLTILPDFVTNFARYPIINSGSAVPLGRIATR